VSRVLRAARSTDAGKVGDILSDFIDTTAWMARIHTRAQDIHHAGVMIAQGWVHVAEVDGRVIAILAREAADVHALYVAKDMRGHRHGRALLQAAQEATDHLWLWTFQLNDGAQRFYSAHGFKEAERTNGAGNDEGLPDIRFEWRKGGK
jgi:GNAT superfamily N-acetyltransferase